MPQVTLTDSPTQQVLQAATQEYLVKDARGRQIALRKPGVLMQYRMVEVMGETAKNEVYMGMILPLMFVASIDGEQVMQPTSKREVEALIVRLDEDGINAVAAAVEQHYGKPNPEAEKDAIKK